MDEQFPDITVYWGPGVATAHSSIVLLAGQTCPPPG
jgi:hypothetical protein